MVALTFLLIPYADAFSGFGRADPKSQEANREVREHTQALFNVIHTVADHLVPIISRKTPS